MSAVAPIITGRVGEDSTGAAFEYVPPSLSQFGSGPPPSISRAFGTFSANGTIVIPAGFAIYDICLLETGGGTISSTLNLGKTPGGTEIFGSKSAFANSWSKLNVSSFLSASSPTTLYLTAASWGTAVINMSCMLIQMV